MKRLLYGEVDNGERMWWEFHGEEACARREGRPQPPDGWQVTLQTFGMQVEELQRQDVRVGASTEFLLCSCIGSPQRRPIKAAPVARPEW
ncbi:hypothetical protein ACIRPQ_28925 [Streptomyces sp. NPDC101213]|uniref:hypothetical protein n=1 Tax=Streptomyces sp. NPDC101213 TaxID=3366130 RepID=UPI0037F217E4